MEEFDIILSIGEELKEELDKLKKPFNPFVETRSINKEIKDNILKIRSNKIDILSNMEQELRNNLINYKRKIRTNLKLNQHKEYLDDKKELHSLHFKYQVVLLLKKEICNLFNHDGEKNGKYYRCKVCNKLIHEMSYIDYKDVSINDISVRLSNSIFSLERKDMIQKILEMILDSGYISYNNLEYRHEVDKIKTMNLIKKN